MSAHKKGHLISRWPDKVACQHGIHTVCQIWLLLPGKSFAHVLANDYVNAMSVNVLLLTRDVVPNKGNLGEKAHRREMSLVAGQMTIQLEVVEGSPLHLKERAPRESAQVCGLPRASLRVRDYTSAMRARGAVFRWHQHLDVLTTLHVVSATRRSLGSSLGEAENSHPVARPEDRQLTSISFRSVALIGDQLGSSWPIKRPSLARVMALFPAALVTLFIPTS